MEREDNSLFHLMKRLQMNKKGSINQLFPATLAIILAGVLLAVGAMIITSFESTSYVNTAAVSANESLSSEFAGPLTLKVGNDARHGVCGALTAVLNGTSNVNIALGNFTQTGCTVINNTDLTTVPLNFTSATYKFTYPYTYDAATTTSTALINTNTSFVSLATTWLPIIVVVIVAGIVLAILLGAFSGKRR